MLGNIIGGFVVIIVGITLAPVVASGVIGSVQFTNASGTYSTNITGASSSIIQLTTLFFCLAVAVVGVSMTVVGLRQSGLM